LENDYCQGRTGQRGSSARCKNTNSDLVISKLKVLPVLKNDYCQGRTGQRGRSARCKNTISDLVISRLKVYRRTGKQLLSTLRNVEKGSEENEWW